MKNKAVKLLVIFSMFLMFINWDYYNPEMLKSMVKSKIHFEDAGIEVEVKVFTEEECKKIFVHNLIQSGYYPVQLTIHNDTEKTYSICPSSVDLKSATPKEILNKIAKKSLPRKIAYSIIGFFFWPMAIPSAIDDMVSHKLKKHREKGMLAKSVKVETIPAYSTVTRIIFIPKAELKKDFTITLIDLDSLKPAVHRHSAEGIA